MVPSLVRHYVDPSVMTYTIQAVAALAVALSAVVGVAFRRTRRIILRILHIDENAGMMIEPDVQEIQPASKAEVDIAFRRELESLEGIARSVPRLAWGSRFIRALVVCVGLCFTVMFVAPVELVASAPNDLVFGVSLLWRPLALAALLTSLVLSLALSALRGRAFDLALVLVSALCLCCYVEAIALNGPLPVANGAMVDWDNYTKITLLSLFVWALILVGSVFLALRRTVMTRAVSVLASIILVIIQAVGVWSIWPTASAIAAESSPNVSTCEGLYEVSPSGNVIVFVLDMTDSQDLELVLDWYPDFLDDFTGFTAYTNPVGSMIPTRYGMPFLLTQQTIRDYDTVDAYYAGRYEDSCFMDDVLSSGYEFAVYTDTIGSQEEVDFVAERAFNVHPTENFEESLDVMGALRILYKCALYRDLTWVLKPPFWYSTDELNLSMLIDSDAGSSLDNTIYPIDDDLFHRYLDQLGLSFSESDVPAVRVIHMMGAHFPYTLNEDGYRSALPTDVFVQFRGAFKIVGTYLEELRSLGIYDDTTIIITADHGKWAVVEDELYEPTAPIILYKPGNQTPDEAAQPCVISDLPVDHLDVHPTVLASIGAGEDVLYRYDGMPLDEVTSYDRPRYFVMTATLEDGSVDTALKEYEIDGQVHTWEDWHLTGREWDY